MGSFRFYSTIFSSSEFFCWVSTESGFAPQNIIRVINGECVGTLFHRDAHLFVHDVNAREMAVASRECSRKLQVEIIASFVSLLVPVFLHVL